MMRQLPPRDDPWWIEAPIAEICRPLSAAVKPMAEVQTNPFGGSPASRKKRNLRKKARQLRCAVPGCERLLLPGNRTGLCREHVHAVGLCRCARCIDTGHASMGARDA